MRNPQSQPVQDTAAGDAVDGWRCFRDFHLIVVNIGDAQTISGSFFDQIGLNNLIAGFVDQSRIDFIRDCLQGISGGNFYGTEVQTVGRVREINGCFSFDAH